MLYNKGKTLSKNNLLKQKTIENMISNHISSLKRKGTLLSESYGFGLGVEVRIKEGKEDIPGSISDYGWRGLGGCVFWVDPKKDIFVIFMMQDIKNRIYFRNLIRKLVYQ